MYRKISIVCTSFIDPSLELTGANRKPLYQGEYRTGVEAALF